MKPVLQIGILALLLCSHSVLLSGQTTIRGIVLAPDSKTPLPYATIRIMRHSEWVITDEEGKFTLESPKSLPVTLVVDHLAYHSKFFELVTEEPEHQLILDDDIKMLDPVIVSASRKVEKKTSAPSAISTVHSPKLRSEALFNPVLSLRNLPGTDIQEQGIGTYQIGLRGRTTPVEGGETFILEDYRQLNIPGLLFSPFSLSAITDIDLDRVEVVRGPASALYGPGMEAGLVHFISKNPFLHPGTAVSLFGGQQSMFGVSVRHAGVLDKKLGYKLVGTYRRADNWAFDENDPVDAAILDRFARNIVSARTGQEIEVDTDENEVENLNLNLTLDYKFSPETHLVLTGGYGFATQRGVTATDYFKYNKLPNIFGQARLSSKRLFAQIYFRNVPNKEHSISYLSGVARYSVGTQVEGQIQYQLPSLFTPALDVTIGSDYRLTFVDTQRTFAGRNEDNDDYSIWGTYIQAEYKWQPNIKIIGAGRLDHFAAVEQTTFSPRLGIQWDLAPNHKLRLVGNRAFGLLGANENYFDFRTGGNPLFDVYLWGAAMLLEYQEPIHMTSYFGSDFDGTPGIPLGLAYDLVLNNLRRQAAPPSPDLLNYLETLAPSVNGFVDGHLFLNGNRVDQLFTRSEPSKTMQTDQLELGYKGIFKDKLVIDAAVYRNRRKNFFSVQAANPFVLAPGLGDALGEAVSGIIDPDALPEGATTSETLELLAGAGNALGNAPPGIGIVEPNDARLNDRPELLVTFLNFGKIKYWGAELALRYFVTDHLTLFANHTWLSQQFFDSEEIEEPGTNLTYSLSNPENRFRMGVDLTPEIGWFGSAAFRYQDGYEVVSGTVTSGVLPSVTVVDGTIGYHLNTGYSVSLTANNLFDRRYRPFPGIPKIGRLVIAKISYNFNSRKKNKKY